MDKPVRPGDFVSIEKEVDGTIIHIGWRSTHIRLLANNTVIIPNSKIVNARITNYDFPEKEMSVLVGVGVAYGSDLRKVERVTIEVAKKVLSQIQGGVLSFEPFIRYHTFNSSSIDFNVILRVKEFTDQFLVKHEFVMALHERFMEEGITIPFPQRVVTMQKTQE